MSPENQWLDDVFPTEIVTFRGHVGFPGSKCYCIIGSFPRPYIKQSSPWARLFMNLPNPRHPALIPQQRTRHLCSIPGYQQKTQSQHLIYIYISIKPVLGGNEFQWLCSPIAVTSWNWLICFLVTQQKCDHYTHYSNPGPLRIASFTPSRIYQESQPSHRPSDR